MKIVPLDRDYWPHGGFGHWCPGCNSGHEIDVAGRHGVDAAKWAGPKWTFDGNMEMPTFTPSVNLQINPKNHKHYNPDVGSIVCHYNITAGKIIFHGDCTHALKGQTVDLPEIPSDKYLTSRWKAGERNI